VVDVLDATNAWLREVPYVIALGCVDGEWPQVPAGHFPTAVQSRIHDNDTTAAKQLPSREQWSTARGYDHWSDVVGMAAEHLVCTRYTRERDGSTAHRSPFLETVSPTTVDGEAITALLSTRQTLPDHLNSALDVGDESPPAATTPTDNSTAQTDSNTEFTSVSPSGGDTQ
jgi:ATP-dependent helicase/nuclease subunit B